MSQIRECPLRDRWVWRLAWVAILSASLVLWLNAPGGTAQDVSSEGEKPKDTFELSLEDIKRLSVSAASKREQLEWQAPASITVLNADDIKKFGYRTLADALASVPGFYMSYDRSRSFLGLRGFNRGDFNSRI